jgi:phosphoenolpyruvate-protein kinase (PTS system EI component)
MSSGAVDTHGEEPAGAGLRPDAISASFAGMNETSTGAAIVFRELGIPCVVGTADATKVLHDGQLMTVDAGMGTVTAGASQPPPVEAPAAAPVGADRDSELVAEVFDAISVTIDTVERTRGPITPAEVKHQLDEASEKGAGR